MQEKKNLNVLVAGGAGFIGSHLCIRLIKDGFNVLCVDNLSTGNLNNVISLFSNERFTFKEYDVTSPLDINGVSMIFNLTCPASPIQYQKDPLHTFQTSILGSINLLNLARKNNVRILLASTSEVYGNPLASASIQDESYWGDVNPYDIRSCYDEGKRGTETLFHDYYIKYGVDTRIIRIFNTHGSNMSTDDGIVVSKFIVQSLKEIWIKSYTKH